MAEQTTDNENDLKYLISQKEGITSYMQTGKQNEQNLKEFMEQQQKMLQETLKNCHELSTKTDFLRNISNKELKDGVELIKILTSATELMNTNIENFHLLRNSMQLCINYQNEANESKQKVLESFEKAKHDKYCKEQDYIKQINDSSELFNNCKQDHLNISTHLDAVRHNNIQEILKYKQHNINIHNQIINTDESANIITEEINILKEDNNLNNEYSELIIKINEFNERKKNKESEYNTKIFDLTTEQANLIENYLTLKTELENLHKDSDNKNEFLNLLNNQKASAEGKFSNLNINFVENEKELNELNKQKKQVLEDHNNTINILNTQINELQDNNKLSEDENQMFEKKLSDLNNEEKEINTELLALELSLVDNENASTKENQLFEENHLKFKAEMSALEKILHEELKDEIILEEEQQEFEAQLQELNEKYEELILRSDAASAEAEVEEISINMNVDKLKSAIEKETCKIDEIKADIMQKKVTGEDKLNKLDIEYEENMKKLLSDRDEIDKLNEHYQNDQKANSEELQKLRDSKRTLELQMSEHKVCTQNLQIEMDLKIKEYDKLIQELNALNEKSEILLKDSKENHSFKRPKYDFKIPKFKIPVSKYSSTSDSSIEDLSLKKKRKVAIKRRTDNKSQKIAEQGSQKSIGNFENTKTGVENRPTRKRTARKPVY